MLNKKWVGGCNKDERDRAGGRECGERVTGGGGTGGRGAAGLEAAVPRVGLGGCAESESPPDQEPESRADRQAA